MNKRSYKAILFWVGLAVVVALLFLWNHLFGNSGGSAIIAVDPNTLPGIMTGTTPWNPELGNLRARLTADGLPALAAEGTVLHIHQHIDMYVNGTALTIPAGIGINEDAGFISPIHTHDTTGVIHVESPEIRDFTLGEFFDVWGVRFTADCLGGYCANATNTLKVYVDGSPVQGDPRALVLAAHQEIGVVYGPASSTLRVPSSYAFDPEL